MRRFLFVVICFVLLCPALSAQSILINREGSESVRIDVETLRSISFRDGKMTATYRDGTSESYVLSEIKRLDFDSSTGVEMVSAMDGRISYSTSSGLLLAVNSQGLRLSVFNLGGTMLVDEVLDQQVATVDLSGFEKGVYLVRLDGKTIKIVL